MTLYATLGVKPSTTADGIKKAWRKLAQVLHPDKGGDTEKFKAVQEAYDVLSDPERRAKYDATGSIEVIPPIRIRAAQLIAERFQKVLADLDNGDDDDIKHNDPIQTLRDLFHAELQQGITVNKKLLRGADQAELALLRLRHVEDSEDTVRGILQGIQIGLKQKIAKNEDVMALFRASLDILAEYRYEAQLKTEPAYKVGPAMRLDISKFFTKV